MKKIIGFLAMFPATLFVGTMLIIMLGNKDGKWDLTTFIISLLLIIFFLIITLLFGWGVNKLTEA